MDELKKTVTVIVLIDNVWHYIEPTKKISITETPEGTQYEIIGNEIDHWRDVGEC